MAKTDQNTRAVRRLLALRGRVAQRLSDLDFSLGIHAARMCSKRGIAPPTSLDELATLAWKMDG